MKSALIFLILLPGPFCVAHYYVRFIHAETHEALPDVTLYTTNFSNTIAEHIPDSAGVVKLWVIEDGGYYLYFAEKDGFLQSTFEDSALDQNETLEVVMTPGYYHYDEVQVIYYLPPFRYNFVEHIHKKRVQKQVPVYPDDTWAKFDSIVNGTWFNQKGTKHFNDASELEIFIMNAISYPEHAYRYEIEETVYFRLTFSNEGYLDKIEFAAGNCPDLVVGAASVLRQIAQLKSAVFWSFNPGSVTYLVPIKFVLK